MPSEGDTPLRTLANKLRSMGPPKLGPLIARLDEAEEYEEFLDLVREFLPEREEDILHEPEPSLQVAAFAQYFEDRYFPLDDCFKLGDVEPYADLTRGIPIIPLGMSYEDYHYMSSDWRPGYQLLTYLIENPYDDEGRIALAEACLERVPDNLLQQVPEGGLSPAEAHRLFDDTPYRGVALWGDILWAETGNVFLDIDAESLWEQGLPRWGRETVEHLTREWQQAERTQQEVTNLAEWLEEDPRARFEELLNLLLKRRANG